MVKIFFSLLVTLFLMGCSHASKKLHEKHYQTLLCNDLGGKTEYVLEDRTRVDYLTDEYAIEVDFAKKWAESIGQALFYAQMTGKEPGVGIIVGDGEDRYIKRLQKVSEKFDIKVFIIEKED